MITKSEWNKIKVGSIIKSSNNTLRRVLSASVRSRKSTAKAITLEMIGYSKFRQNTTTTYFYWDLAHTYSIEKI